MRRVLEIGHCSNRLNRLCWDVKLDGVVCNTRSEQGEAWKGMWHARVDGAGIRQHSGGRQFDLWLTDPAFKIKGFEFVMAVKTRLGVPWTPSRASRGRRGVNPSQRICARDRQVASLNHIAQYCEMTHGLRVDRHDAIVAMVHQSLGRRGWQTLKEPRIPVGHTFLKPDLVCLSNDKKRVVVLDPQICSANSSLKLSEVNDAKVAKYNIEEVKSSATRRLGVVEASFEVHGVAISCRGTVPKSTYSILSQLVGRRMSAYIILRVIVLTCKIVDAYRKRIHVSRRFVSA